MLKQADDVQWYRHAKWGQRWGWIGDARVTESACSTEGSMRQTSLRLHQLILVVKVRKQNNPPQKKHRSLQKTQNIVYLKFIIIIFNFALRLI